MRRDVMFAAAAAGLAAILLVATRRSGSSSSPSSSGSKGSSGSGRASSSSSRKPTAKVDAIFLKRLFKLLRVTIPSLFSREAAMLISLIALLLIRTRLTINMSQIVGGNAKALVQRDARKFVAGVLDIGLWSLPSAVVNAGIRYLTSLIEGRFRHNLQLHVHDHYLQRGAVYKVSSGNQVEHPDHRVTKDVLAFCEEVSQSFPLIFKPTIDVIVFIYQLSKNGGLLPPFVMIAYYFVAGSVLRALMPNFAKLTAETQQKEGAFRAIHSQIIQHAEEVAFYRGERTERYVADKGIASLVKHQLKVKQLKSYTDFMDAVLIKYGATCVGYAVCSMGVFALRDAAAAERTRVYIQSSQLYIPLAQAIGKLVLLHNRITALAAYTSRVSEVRELLESLSSASSANSLSTLREVPDADMVSFDRVKITNPAGQVLLNNFSLTIKRYENVLIMGNNGSGKTSLLRVLVGLWPVAQGTITRPPLSDFVFVPQRTYLPHGNMREQLIFPDTIDDARRKGVTDERIMKLVETVGLTSVVLREGGLDGFKSWHEVLSGGERQRVAFVRLLYHRPPFAVLDEATSAVSLDIEPAMYEAAQRSGTTLITVSHREGLKKYHQKLVVLDGEGGASVSDIAPTAE